jgi:PadR family transcriptional regulator PadR
MVPKATKATVKVLEAFLENLDEEQYGFGLYEKTRLKSGTLYPILMRLEDLRWIEGRWEDSDRNGPRRRLYRLTGDYIPAAEKLVERHRMRSESGTPAVIPRPVGGSI